MSFFTKFLSKVTPYLLFSLAFCLLVFMVFSLMMWNDQEINDPYYPLGKNITECAKEVEASIQDVETFLNRTPQSTMQGKCFVACILARNSVIKDRKIDLDNLIEINGPDFDEELLKTVAMKCLQLIDRIYEICEYASMFHDCMVMRMDVFDEMSVERRLEMLRMMTDPDELPEEEAELLQMVKKEL